MGKKLKREELILKEYEKQLEERQEKGGIKPITKRTHLTHAHRILESLIKCLPTEMIIGALKKTGFRVPGAYPKVISDLREIAKRRSK